MRPWGQVSKRVVFTGNRPGGSSGASYRQQGQLLTKLGIYLDLQ